MKFDKLDHIFDISQDPFFIHWLRYLAVEELWTGSQIVHVVEDSRKWKSEFWAWKRKELADS